MPHSLSKLNEHLDALRAEEIARLVAENPPPTGKKNLRELSETNTVSDKKRKVSQGVDRLKKASTKGMATMNTFFTKKSKT